MGSKASLQLREEEISAIQKETGCEWCLLKIDFIFSYHAESLSWKFLNVNYVFSKL